MDPGPGWPPLDEEGRFRVLAVAMVLLLALNLGTLLYMHRAHQNLASSIRSQPLPSYSGGPSQGEGPRNGGP